MNVPANINTTFTNWSATILDVYTADETRLKVMIYRALWKARNQLVWNQKGGDITNIITSVKSVLNKWSSAQDKSFDCFLEFMIKEDVIDVLAKCGTGSIAPNMTGVI